MSHGASRIRRWGIALAIVAACAGAIARPAAMQPAWTPAVDAVFAAWNRPDSPGCALGVFANGAMAYEHGYGMADLEHDVPIRPESVFYVGSLSKQFTAMAAALAIEQGRLSPDDSIRKYLPELPAYADAIRIRHLIHHTSGLRDYNTLLSIAGRRGDEAYDNRTVLAMTARQKSLNFPPGEEYLYSNTGYTLLAIVVERATATPFAAFAESRIFKPLGMAVTHYHVDSTRLVKGRAMAYQRGPAGEILLDTPSNERAGAGGVFTSVRDLQRWDENFYDARVGGKGVIERLLTTEPLNDGKPSSYAWGLEIGTYRGLPIVEHGGSLGGYRAHLLRVPSAHMSVALLCNSGSIAPAGLARRVADAVLESRFTGPVPAVPAAAGGRAAPPVERAVERTLEEYVGEYYSQEIDATFTVFVDGSRLMLRRDADARPAELQPTGEDTFRGWGMTIRFAGSSGRKNVTALVVDAGRVRGIRFDRRPQGSGRS
jgi:CubicO group peptidase (beta-lactamase class C family)